MSISTKPKTIIKKYSKLDHKIEKFEVLTDEFIGDKIGTFHLYCRKKNNNKNVNHLLWADRIDKRNFITHTVHENGWGKKFKVTRQFREDEEQYIFTLTRTQI